MNETMDQRLKEIEQRAVAATPGPWRRRYDVDEDGIPIPVHSEMETVAWASHNRPEYAANAEFICHAREDVPWLVEELRKRLSVRA